MRWLLHPPAKPLLAARRVHSGRLLRLRLQQGFTLLEILVVFVIVGFVSTILLQALSQVYRLQERFGQEALHSQDGAMRTEWYRYLLEGLLTAAPGDASVFRGESGRLSGISTAGVDLDGGAPSRFELAVQYDSASRMARVTYKRLDDASTDSKPLELMEWESDAAPSLSYLDQRGGAHDTWPPAFGSWPQLPKLILLKTRRDGADQWLTAAPMGPSEPPRGDAIGVIAP